MIYPFFRRFLKAAQVCQKVEKCHQHSLHIADAISFYWKFVGFIIHCRAQHFIWSFWQIALPSSLYWSTISWSICHRWLLGQLCFLPSLLWTPMLSLGYVICEAKWYVWCSSMVREDLWWQIKILWIWDVFFCRILHCSIIQGISPQSWRIVFKLFMLYKTQPIVHYMLSGRSIDNIRFFVFFPLNANNHVRVFIKSWLVNACFLVWSQFKCVADIISPSIIPADYFKDLWRPARADLCRPFNIMEANA